MRSPPRLFQRVRAYARPLNDLNLVELESWYFPHRYVRWVFQLVAKNRNIRVTRVVL